ncbi:MAG: HEAT repeat domain-containing protein, partial [Candidatus Heimdallarchaeota archaeon]
MNDFKEKNIDLLISQSKESEDIDLRCRALEELGESKDNFDKVVPAITSALDDDNWLVRAEAANALRVIGEKAIPSLATLKNSILEPRNKSKKGVFRSAIIALEKIQTSGPEISVPEE